MADLAQDVKASLGRLERVELRRAWESEPRDFTPWLARPDNISLLGDAIGLELEVESTEKGIGPFRADILCRDTTSPSDHFVLIENQLELTDHKHLGQLLTYAAGLEAARIVWVAERFTDEHQGVLDWLNRITDASFNFFALEIELWRIGDSPYAPMFNVVSQPNDWGRAVRVSAGPGGAVSETQQTYLDFWTQFQRFMEERRSPIKVGKPSKDSWKDFPVGRSNFALVATNSIQYGASWVSLRMSGPSSKVHFHLIEERQHDLVESVLGVEVEWAEKPNYNESSIYLQRESALRDKSSWPELNAWFAENLERMDALFRPIVRDLDASDYVSSESLENTNDEVDFEPANS